VSQEQRVIRFYLPGETEKQPIVVVNLLKEIKCESPELYLNLKTRMRALGLYHEEFSIIYGDD
jgi:hypothetical protein